METSQPEVVAAMLSFCTNGFPIGVDGKVRSTRSRRVAWDSDLPAQLTGVFGDCSFAAPSAAAFAIFAIDIFYVHG